MKAFVTVMPKAGVLDPPGKAIVLDRAETAPAKARSAAEELAR